MDLCRILLLWSLVGCGAAAQDARSLAVVPLGPLLQPQFDHGPWLLPVEGAGDSLPQLRGEAALLPPAHEFDVSRRWPAWFSPDELRALLADLTNQPGSAFSFLRGGALVAVDREREPAVRAVIEALQQRLPPVVQIDVSLVREHEGQREVLLARQVECRSGRTAVASALAESSALVDFEVEIANSAAVGNPRIAATWHGAMVALRPIVTPGGAQAVVELLVRTIEPLEIEPIATGHPGFGAIDRAAQRVVEVGRLCRTHLGGLLEQRWGGFDGASYELQVRLQWKVVPPARPGGREVEYLQRLGPLGGFASSRDQAASIEADSLRQQHDLASVFGEEPGLLGAGEGTARVAVGQTAQLLAGTTAAMFDGIQQSAPIEIEVHDVAQGAAAAAEGSRRLGFVRMSWTDDSDAVVQVRDVNGYLRDWDCEVAQSSRIPDPKVHRLETGLVLDLRRSRERIEIRGEYSARGELRTVTTPISQAMLAREAMSVSVPSKEAPTQTRFLDALVLPADTVVIEQPITLRAPFTAQATLRAGADTTVRIAAPPLGRDRELLLTLRLLQ